MVRFHYVSRQRPELTERQLHAQARSYYAFHIVPDVGIAKKDAQVRAAKAQAKKEQKQRNAGNANNNNSGSPQQSNSYRGGKRNDYPRDRNAYCTHGKCPATATTCVLIKLATTLRIVTTANAKGTQLKTAIASATTTTIVAETTSNQARLLTFSNHLLWFAIELSKSIISILNQRLSIPGSTTHAVPKV